MDANTLPPLTTPVAFFIFNRPAVTQRVFDAIAAARPTRLFIVADGPRPAVASDSENCARARAVTEHIDWDCDVKTDFSEVNLGCRDRIVSGLSWVFDQAASAIILEDDCLPHSTFFPFCQELLNRYRDDTRIMSISGDNFQFGRQRRNPDDYYFSLHHHIWGWATWRRAWDLYDIHMTDLPELIDMDWLVDLFGDRRSARVWADIMRASYNGQMNTWDHQWIYTCLKNSGLTILPKVNLVRNIGFTADSTHTRGGRSPLADMAVSALSLPLRHPKFIIRDAQADRHELRILKTALWKRIKARINRLFF